MKLKIKKDKLHIIYWTIAVVSVCFLTLTNIEWRQIAGFSTGFGFLIQGIFDKDFSK